MAWGRHGRSSAQEKESVLFRVIDTPGLHDTNLGPESIKLEYECEARTEAAGDCGRRLTAGEEEEVAEVVVVHGASPFC